MSGKPSWFERFVALFFLPLCLFDKRSRESLWLLFRYGVVSEQLAEKIK